MKILFLHPNFISKYNWTHQLFRNEFARHHKVWYYGEGFPNYIPNKPIQEVVRDIDGVDLIITHGLRYTLPFSGLGEISNIPKAHIAVDYFPDATGGTYEPNHKLFERDKYDIYFGVVSHITRNLEANGICKKAHLLPFSIDTNVYRKLDIWKKYDIFCVYTKRDDTYPNRYKIQKMVEKMSTVYDVVTDKCVHEEYIQKINESKLGITSNNKFKSLSIKYYEIMGCGTMLLADEPEDFYELGFMQGYHCVFYTDPLNLRDEIEFFTKKENDTLRETIAKNGYEFIRKNHNNEVRVKQMMQIIQNELGIK